MCDDIAIPDWYSPQDRGEKTTAENESGEQIGKRIGDRESKLPAALGMTADDWLIQLGDALYPITDADFRTHYEPLDKTAARLLLATTDHGEPTLLPHPSLKDSKPVTPTGPWHWLQSIGLRPRL